MPCHDIVTMDIIKLYDGETANFFNALGDATAQQSVKEAFKITPSDPKLHFSLTNIFGDIMDYEAIAESIVSATKELDMNMSIVRKLQGNIVGEANKMIRLRIIPRHEQTTN